MSTAHTTHTPATPHHWSGDQTNWVKDMNEAERTGKTVCQIEEERKLTALVQEIHPKALTDLEKREAKLARDREQLEAERAAMNADMRKWDGLLTQWEKLQRSQNTGEHLLGAVSSFAGSLKDSIFKALNHEHPQPAFHEFPQHVIATANDLNGAEKVLSFADEWRTQLTAKFDTLGAELIALAKKQNICDRLPSELQAKAK